jgi:trehalose-6-phosphate synthase
MVGNSPLQLMNNLDRILDDAMALPPNQQEMLMQILQRRIVERRRDEIAQDAIESLAEFRSGKLKPQTATEAIAELRSFLENDRSDG